MVISFTGSSLVPFPCVGTLDNWTAHTQGFHHCAGCVPPLQGGDREISWLSPPCPLSSLIWRWGHGNGTSPTAELATIFNALVLSRLSSYYPIPKVTCSCPLGASFPYFRPHPPTYLMVWSCFHLSTEDLERYHYLVGKEKLVLSYLHIQSCFKNVVSNLYGPILHTFSPIPLLHSLITDFIFFSFSQS